MVGGVGHTSGLVNPAPGAEDAELVTLILVGPPCLERGRLVKKIHTVIILELVNYYLILDFFFQLMELGVSGNVVQGPLSPAQYWVQSLELAAIRPHSLGVLDALEIQPGDHWIVHHVRLLSVVCTFLERAQIDLSLLIFYLFQTLCPQELS